MLDYLLAILRFETFTIVEFGFVITDEQFQFPNALEHDLIKDLTSSKVLNLHIFTHYRSCGCQG